MAVPRCGWCARGFAVLAVLVAESRFEHIVRAIRPRFCCKKGDVRERAPDAAVGCKCEQANYLVKGVNGQ